MRMNWTWWRVAGALCCLITVGYGGLSTAEEQGAGASFTISVDPSMFFKGRQLRVRLWSEEQLRLNETNAQCLTSYDSVQKVSTMHCPEGIVYKDLAPEEFMFSMDQTDGQLSLTSRSAKEGERYKIEIFGKSSDGCNSTSAHMSGHITANPVVIQGLTWSTTLMGCAPTLRPPDTQETSS